MISALIFDLDGTLFDSTDANIAAYTKAFQSVGVDFDEQKYRQMFGLRFNEMIEQLAPSTDEPTRAKIKSLKADFYKQSLDLVKPNDGLINLLKSANQSYKTALTTTASRTNVVNLLDHFGIPESAFKVIITGEDVSRGKPDPECYLKTIEALNVEPSECCVFEDSSFGIEAAQKAGTEVIKITI